MEVFYIKTEEVRNCDISRIKHIMPKRFAKANAYKQEKDRLLCLGGAILMADIVGITNESDICFNSSGKPFANGFPEFNISHSGDVCVLAVGDGQVGIDIEKADCENLTIAENVFSDKEYEWMCPDPVVRFHRLWTLKESLLKAAGIVAEICRGASHIVNVALEIRVFGDYFRLFYETFMAPSLNAPSLMKGNGTE